MPPRERLLHSAGAGAPMIGNGSSTVSNGQMYYLVIKSRKQVIKNQAVPLPNSKIRQFSIP
jgi:hypothetical protein